MLCLLLRVINLEFLFGWGSKLIVGSFELSSVREGLYCTEPFTNLFVGFLGVRVSVSRDRTFLSGI